MDTKQTPQTDDKPQLTVDEAYSQANLVGVLRSQGKLDEAVTCLQKILAINPDIAEAHRDFGNILKEQGKLDEAVAIYKKAISISPDSPDILSNLSHALNLQGKLDQAIIYLEKAISINPNSAQSHNNLGIILKNQGKLGLAIASYRKAISIKPDYAEAHGNIAGALKDQGKLPDAIESYRKALSIKPDLVKVHSNMLLCMLYGNYEQTSSLYEHKLWNDRHAEPLKSSMCKHKKGVDQEKKLHIGFVSGDFRNHAVSYFLESFFETYSKKKLKFYCYYNFYNEDVVTARFQKMVDGWRKIAGQSDQVVVEMIQADNIDILVDLSGHTKNNRLLVFARKPAPIQVAWFGYPNATGLAAMDYMLTDYIMDPAGQSDQLHVEKLIRLPGGILCYKPPEVVPDVAPLPMKNKGYVTFVSFNNLAKVTPTVIKIWARILNNVPGSKLLIKNNSITCREVRQRYISLFEKESVSENRLILVRRSPEIQDHLAKYGRVDIGLDTFPFNGITTTCEALWMGIPVVVLRGDHHLSRVGASLLTHVGLESLIAEDVDDYIEKATNLASDISYLENLRKGMRIRLQNSPLCNPEEFAKKMENAFRSMWTSML
jgi:protein O-GlcNAc transferase